MDNTDYVPKPQHIQTPHFHLLPGPAQRALGLAGIKTPRQLSQFTQSEIRNLHGIGPSAFPIFKKILAHHRLNWTKEVSRTDPTSHYISQFEPAIQKRLKQIRKAIRQEAGTAIECMRYGMPTYRTSENLVHFAGYKNHIGFYPTPTAILKFKKELKNFTCSKGAIQFSHDNPLPIALIQKIVRFRIRSL